MTDPRPISPEQRNQTLNRLFIAAIVVFLALAPLWFADYAIYRLSQACIYALAIVGLNLLVGLSGQLSVGHSAFFALGAYSVALIAQDNNALAYIAIPIAGLICFVFGVVFGLTATRLSNLHLLLATWGLALALPQLLKSSHLEPWTGGVSGIYLEKPDTPFGLPLSTDQWWHYLALLALVLLLPMAHGIARGRIGRALYAVRDNEQAAKSIGVDVALYKALIFGVSAFYAGVAGGLAALLSDFVAPGTYDIFFALFLLVGAVVSGLAGVWTAIFGGLMIEFMPDAAAFISNDKIYPGMTFGILLIIMIYLMPEGLAGQLRRLRLWLAQR